jgi:lipoprotein NlpD
MWPGDGKLLSQFSEPNSKGVDLGGKAGDPVLAAAGGRVMYVGSGIRGYGNLVIIKHSSGFLSAYAHNRKILVKENQSVAKGQKIAELGDSDADQAKLHFEIRRQGKPVDPLQYLPPR